MPKDGQALSMYGEKTNGEVAVSVEFLDGGYSYGLMFIYENREYAEARKAERERVVQSINVGSE